MAENFKPDAVEQIYTGLSLEWYANRQLVCYTVTLITQTVLETWAELVIETLNTWDKTRPYLAFHDLSHQGVALQYASLVGFNTVNIGITSAGLAQAKAIIEANEYFEAKVAVNFNLSVSGQVNRVLADQQTPLPDVQYRTFYKRDSAFEWLAEFLPPNEDD